MENSTVRPVVFVPGSILPAAVQYEPILSILKDEVQPLLKDLEVYSGDTPSPDYGLSLEVERLRQASEAAGWNSFHLVGYSGGGTVALAFTASYPERVKSLALSEPAVIPSPEWFQKETDFWGQIERVMLLPPNEQMREFTRLQLRPGVQPPPSPAGDPPPWMAKRPAGIKAMVQSFSSSRYTFDQFRRFHKPVYLAIGDLSNPVWERMAETMAGIFPKFQMEVYEGRHHFDPPQRAEPERFADALVHLWRQAEAAQILPLTARR